MKSFGSILLGVFLMAGHPVLAAKEFLYAGSYTNGSSKGIYAWIFNDRSGALSSLGLVAQTPQAAHLWVAPGGKTLYAVNWEQLGGISAYRINSATGALVFLNRVSAHGALPNQVMVDPSGRVAIAVNYASGSMAAFKLEPDGKLGEAFYVDKHTGVPLSPKQPGAKQHGIQFSKDNRFVFITDLGLDRIYSYRFDPAGPSIVTADPPYVETHVGAGPRRIQISRDGQHLYVDHETDSEVEAFAIDGSHLTSVQTLDTVPIDAKAKNTTAEILIAPDGKHLYVANRGDDSIAIFAINQKTGLLTAQARVPSGGRTPRNIRFDLSGHWFFAANENSGTIVVFKVDKITGQLTPIGTSLPVETPGGMAFSNRD